MSANEQEESAAQESTACDFLPPARQRGDTISHSPLRITRLSRQLECSVSQVSLLPCLRTAGTCAGWEVTTASPMQLWRQKGWKGLLHRA